MSEKRDSITTIDGELVEARIGQIQLDADPVAGGVVLSTPDMPRPISLHLTADEVRRLAHALSCAVEPYGWMPVL